MKDDVKMAQRHASTAFALTFCLTCSVGFAPITANVPQTFSFYVSETIQRIFILFLQKKLFNDEFNILKFFILSFQYKN